MGVKREAGTLHACITQHFLSVSKISTVSEAMNDVARSIMYNAARLFHGESSSDNTMLLQPVREL
jgi:hypothetical protein